MMATIGDNRPPEGFSQLAERLAEDHAALLQRTEELVAALERAPTIVDESNFDRTSAFVRQLREHSKLARGDQGRREGALP